MNRDAHMSDSLEARCHAEVLGLHAFFTDWFCGRLPATDEAFSRCERALGPGFQLVSPRGVVDGRASLLAGIRAAHGQRTDFRITIKDFAWRPLPPGTLGLATYTEWQATGDAVTGRISTATMAADERAPGGVVWLHVHETFCPGSSSDQDPPARDPVLARFERGEYTPAEFTHERHVEVAWRYVREFPLWRALDRCSRAIQRFAARHGKHGLYHETITWAYLMLISERVARAEGDEDFASFAAANQDIMTRGKHVLRQYYSDDRLWSESARTRFVWPDRGGDTDPAGNGP